MMVILRETASNSQLSSLLIRKDWFLGEVSCGNGWVAASVSSPNEQHWLSVRMRPNNEPNCTNVRVVSCYILGIHWPLGGEKYLIHRIQATLLTDSLVDTPTGNKFHGVRVDQQELVVITCDPCLRAVVLCYRRQTLPAVCDRSGVILEFRLEELIQLEQVISGPDVDPTHTGVRVQGHVLK